RATGSAYIQLPGQPAGNAGSKHHGYHPPCNDENNPLPPREERQTALFPGEQGGQSRFTLPPQPGIGAGNIRPFPAAGKPRGREALRSRANAPRMLKWARFFLIRTGWVVEKRPVFCSVISQTDNKC